MTLTEKEQYELTIKNMQSKIDYLREQRENLTTYAKKYEPLTDEQRTALRDAFAQALTGVYVCGRVWEAWQYGTMSEGDFQPASECEEVLDSIIEAAHGIK